MNAKRFLRNIEQERSVLYGIETIWSELASMVNASVNLNPEQEARIVYVVALMISKARLSGVEITDMMVMSVATYINSCR